MPPVTIVANLIIYFWYLFEYIYQGQKSNDGIERESDILSIILSAICLIALMFVLFYGVRATRVDPEDTIIGL